LRKFHENFTKVSKTFTKNIRIGSGSDLTCQVGSGPIMTWQVWSGSGSGINSFGPDLQHWFYLVSCYRSRWVPALLWWSPPGEEVQAWSFPLSQWGSGASAQQVWPKEQGTFCMAAILLTIVPDTKLWILDPDPQNENQEFRIRILL